MEPLRDGNTEEPRSLHPEDSGLNRLSLPWHFIVRRGQKGNYCERNVETQPERISRSHPNPYA